MRSIPIDSNRLELTYFECVPAFDQSGIQKTDRNDGRPIWSVRCLARQTDSTFKPELIEVRVASLTDLGQHLTPFTPVTFDNLTCRAWAMADDRGNGVRDGLSFTADGASTGKPSRNGKVTPAAPEVVPA
jgi:hypothetical protein